MRTKNEKEAARKKSLGELGELFAIKALVDMEFDRIRNLNDKKLNEPFADIECEKGGERYIISVKARNKFQKDGKLNTRYNLGAKVNQKAADAERKHKAKAYWMAIQFDVKTYSVYLGSLDELSLRKAIPIRECERGVVGACLVRDKRHYFDFSFFENKKAESGT